MSVRTDQVNLRVIVNGNAAKKELADLDQEYIRLNAEIKKMKKGTDEYIATQKRLSEVAQKQAELKKEIGLTSLSLKELNKEATKLRMMRSHLTPGTQAFHEVDAQLKAVQKRISEVNSGLTPFQQAWRKVSLEAKAAVGFLAAAAVWDQIMGIVQGSVNLDEALADVAKTTGMTKMELVDLQKTLGEIDTRTTRSELLEIAKVGGQMGLLKKDIASYTEAIDKVNVAVGDEFQGGVEDVATEFGILRNVLLDIKSDKPADDIMYMANALNELSANGASTVPVMVNMSNRMGGVLSNMKVTTGQIFGMSAAMQELGIAEERGSTAVVKIFQKMITNSKEFAAVAGMDVKAFKELMDKDMYAAFMAVVKGSKEAGNSNTKLGAIIKDLEVNGAGASEVFAKFGGNLDLVQSKVDMATESLKGMDSITNEFNIKNATLGAVMEKMGRDLRGLFVNETVKNGVKQMALGLADLVKWLKENKDAIVFMLKVVGLLTAAYITNKLASAGLVAIEKAHAVVKALVTKNYISNTTATRINELAMQANGKMMNWVKNIQMLYIAVTSKSTNATHLFNLAIKSTPWGMIISLATTAYMAYRMFNKEQDETVRQSSVLEDAQKKYNERLSEEIGHVNALFYMLKQTNPQSERRLKLINEINEKYGTTLKNMEDETAFANQLKVAYDELIKSLTKKVAIESQDAALKEAANKHIKAQEELIMLEDALAEYRKKDEAGEQTWRPDDFKDFDPLHGLSIDQAYDRIEELRKLTESYDKEMEQIFSSTQKVIDKFAGVDDFTGNEDDENKKKAALEKAKKALEDRINAQKASANDLAKYLNEANEEFLRHFMSTEEKIIHEIGYKYAQRIHMAEEALAMEKKLIDEGKGDQKRANEFELALLELRKQQELEIANKFEELERERKKKYDEDRVAAEKEITEALMDEYQKKEHAIITHFDKLIELNKKFHITDIDLEVEKQKALDKLRAERAKKEKKELEDWQTSLQKKMQMVESIYGQISNVTNSILQFIANKEEAELQRYKAAQDEKIKKLDERFAKGLISEQAYNQEKLRIETETANKEKAMKTEAFKRQKTADMIMAGIKTALAVVNALATAPWPTSIAFAALAAAAGAAEIAAIANKPVPEFREGKIFEGPSHDSPSRGLPVVDPNSGQPVAMVEGGEGLIPKKAVDENRPIVEALIEAGRRDGKLSPVNFSNIVRSMEAVQRRKYSPVSASYATGDSTKRAKVKQGADSSSAMVQKMVQQNAKLIELNEKLIAAVEEERARPAIVSLRQWDKSLSEREKIRRLAGA